MDAEIRDKLIQILQQWQTQDREIGERVAGLRDWMQQVNQLGIPHFGETADRLRPLQQQMVDHFQLEDQMTDKLAKALPPSSPELRDLRQHSAEDHNQLFSRLDDLINRLDQTEPPFDSWQAAMDEVALLLEALGQHEESESESVKMLLSIGD